MLIVLPRINDLEAAKGELAVASLFAVAFLAAMFFAGTKVIPALLGSVARLGSRELFLVTVVALGIGIGYGTYLSGLSFAFGAFVAGMVLSESEFSHQALSDIVPLRDVFGLLFFASAGMLFDPLFLFDHFREVLLAVSAVIAGKALLLGGITRAFGYGNAAPFIVGLGLAQIGEFSFVLARAGVQSGGLSQDAYSLALTATVVTMLISPLLNRAAIPLYDLWRRASPQAVALDTKPLPGEPLSDHVILIGYGRIARAAIDVMRMVDLKFVVIELDHARAEDARRHEHPCLWGDATRAETLEAAGLARARLMVVTAPSAPSIRLIVEQSRRLAPGLHIVVRALYAEHLKELAALGIFEVVQPELEAGLEMVRQVLLHYGVAPADVYRFSEAVRSQAYQPLRDEGLSQRSTLALEGIRRAGELLSLEWLTVTAGSAAAGVSLGTLELRKRTGVAVVAVQRAGRLDVNPGSEFVLEARDSIAVISQPDQLEAVRGLVSKPSQADTVGIG
jgi:CPA2 family monovalent cation:H+ antiporter-2